MYDSAIVLSQWAVLSLSAGQMLVASISVVLAGAVALLGLGYGFRSLSLYIYNNGGVLRRFGKPRWKGYNRWRSEKWNMEHTA